MTDKRGREEKQGAEEETDGEWVKGEGAGGGGLPGILKKNKIIVHVFLIVWYSKCMTSRIP